MFEGVQFRYRLSQLQGQQRKIAAQYKRDLKEAKKAKKSHDDIDRIKYDAHFEDRDSRGAISELQTFYLISLADKYLVPLPDSSDWESDEDALPYRYLKSEATARLRAAVRVEQDASWNRWNRMLSILGVAAGLLGVYMGVLSFRSQYEERRAVVHFGAANFQTTYKAVPPQSFGRYAILTTPHEKVVEVTMDVTNEGNSTTRNFRSKFICQPVSFDKVLTDPFDLFHWDETSAAPDVVAPKQTIKIAPCQLTMDNIQIANDGGREIYLLGEIRYYDATNMTNQRVTQFAQRVAITDFDEKTGKFTTTNTSVGRHNCADEECPR